MIDGFEIKCKKCGNTAVDIKGTSMCYGHSVRVQFKCLVEGCGNIAEVPVTQVSFPEFIYENCKDRNLGIEEE